MPARSASAGFSTTVEAPVSTSSVMDWPLTDARTTK